MSPTVAAGSTSDPIQPEELYVASHLFWVRQGLAKISSKAGFILKKTMKILISFLGGALVLGSCTSPLLAQDQEVQTPSDKFEADIGIANHTDDYIYATMVEGAPGGHAHKMSAGVGNMCCVTLPRKWHDSLEVKVDWDVPEGTKHIYKTKVVKVEKYEGAGTLYLHFFPDDGVRVVVSRWIGASPKHPIPPPPGTVLHWLQ